MKYFPGTRNFSLDFELRSNQVKKRMWKLKPGRFSVVPPIFSYNSKLVGTESRKLDGKVGILLSSVMYANNVHSGQANTIYFKWAFVKGSQKEDNN